jgi:hypothetical protein
MEHREQFFKNHKPLVLTAAAITVGIASYYIFYKKHHKIHKLTDPFFSENVLSYSIEASARATQLQNVRYNLLIDLSAE